MLEFPDLFEDEEDSFGGVLNDPTIDVGRK